MGWTPDEVRACTYRDIIAAWHGHLRNRGIDPEAAAPERFSRESLKALMARFPDDKKVN